MAFPPGGRSDKLGNRYEERWVAKQLLRLLKEEINSVTVESIGLDEIGVDLWIELKNGTREAHQCKARNGSKEKWTVSDLKSRGILKNLSHQLGRIQYNQFVLISGIPATQIGDICVDARNSRCPEEFHQYMVNEISASRRKAFQTFCEGTGIDPKSIEGRRKAHDYLKRTRFELYPLDDNTFNDLLSEVSLLLNGKKELILESIIAYSKNHDYYGKPIFADNLLKYLAKNEIYPKNLIQDSRVLPVIKRLNNNFEDSISPRLINNELLHREETDKCLKAIEEKQIIFLHGKAGVGKSTVLYEITKILKEKEIPSIQLRLDRHLSDKTAAFFGRDLDLPDSPAKCLIDISGPRACVLILDQLDALRWTSTHSSSALEVCKEMISQVLLAGKSKKACIVVSCRTFDLRHDPAIIDLLNNQRQKNETRITEIEVKPLPEPIVREIVGNFYNNMSSKQKKILSNPQNLKLWVELSTNKKNSPFRSQTDLIKKYWGFKRKQIERNNITATDLNKLVATLVNYMEKNAIISAPARIVRNCSKKTLNALKSQGIIDEKDSRITFCHQSYIDFLIAENLLAKIDDGGTILEWLGPKEKQSLLHREQLRYALVLLMDESSATFCKSIEEMFSSNNVRFLYKRLALEVINQVEDVSYELEEFCLKLLSKPDWKNHALGTIFLDSTPLTEILIKKGIILEWLESGKEEEINRALNLLKAIVEKSPDLVANLLPDFIDKGGKWLQHVNNTLCLWIEDDSDAMFDLRLKLAQCGIVTDHLELGTLSKKHPVRVLRLLDAAFSFISGIKESNAESRFFKTLSDRHDKEIQKFFPAIEAHPEKSWELFVPHLEKLLSKIELYKNRFLEKRFSPERTKSRDYRGYTDVLVLFLKTSGKLIAEKTPEVLFQWSKPMEQSNLPDIQRLIADVYTHLPNKYADKAIQWLLADVNRFELGNGISETKYKPAVRLIERFSLNCSEDIYKKLETAIVHYHVSDEKSKAKLCLELRKEGIYHHFWGDAQLFLLPALSRERRNKKTDDLIIILKRKFSVLDESDFYSGRSSSVHPSGSNLSRNLEQISDNTWLNIIKSKKNPEINYARKKKFEGKSNVSSVEQFAWDLETIAKKYPERFGQLALKFPDYTHPTYISSILEAMAQTNPIGSTEEEKNSWSPASIETALAVWEKFSNLENREVAMAFCKLVSSHSDKKLPENVIQKLLYFTSNYHDQDLERMDSLYCNKEKKATIEDLFHFTINCVKGVAVKAIGDILWHRQDFFEKSKPLLKQIIKSEHPVVRMAAVKLVLPILNINQEIAVDWFYELSKNDLRIPASYHAMQFLNYSILDYYKKLKPLIQEMIGSDCPDVSQAGAEMVTGYYVFHALFKKELETCKRGTSHLRMGIAKVASCLIRKKEYEKICRELLLPILDDPDSGVRNHINFRFSKISIESDENVLFIKKYIKSKTFADNPFNLIHGLKKNTGSLLSIHEVIIEMCEEIATTLLEQSKTDRPKFDSKIRDIPALLLRLYEQAHEKDRRIANRCMDIWDLFFEKRVGDTRTLTKAITDS